MYIAEVGEEAYFWLDARTAYRNESCHTSVSDVSGKNLGYGHLYMKKPA